MAARLRHKNISMNVSALCAVKCVCVYVVLWQRKKNITPAILICYTLYRAWLFVNHIFQLVISKPASC